MHEDIEIYLRKGKGYWFDGKIAHMIDNKVGMPDDYLIKIYNFIVTKLWLFRNDLDLKAKRIEIRNEIIKRGLENSTKEILEANSWKFDEEKID